MYFRAEGKRMNTCHHRNELEYAFEGREKCLMNPIIKTGKYVCHPFHGNHLVIYVSHREHCADDISNIFLPRFAITKEFRVFQ